jgi:hypothetical protein
VVFHKGSLHNRITKLIHLKPFSLSETAAFLKANKIELNDYSILQLYMAMGGIPHYLKEIGITFITCFGVQQNAYSLDLVQNEISATRSFFH